MSTTATAMPPSHPKLKAGPDRYEGLVVKANHEKRYAFLRSQLGDIFCHFSQVRSIAPDGSYLLSDGDFVHFYVSVNTNRPMAMHVRIVPEK
jgi:cold shock CspA family protein